MLCREWLFLADRTVTSPICTHMLFKYCIQTRVVFNTHINSGSSFKLNWLMKNASENNGGIFNSRIVFKLTSWIYWFDPQPRLRNNNMRVQVYTNFLASKKLLRCLICQKPMATRINVWTMDHHRTLWLVLSLVCLKRSSRYWKRHSKAFRNTNSSTQAKGINIWTPTRPLLTSRSDRIG